VLAVLPVIGFGDQAIVLTALASPHWSEIRHPVTTSDLENSALVGNSTPSDQI
jgi:hypothetical protein